LWNLQEKVTGRTETPKTVKGQKASRNYEKNSQTDE